jgi:hypothetical protein
VQPAAAPAGRKAGSARRHCADNTPAPRWLPSSHERSLRARSACVSRAAATVRVEAHALWRAAAPPPRGIGQRCALRRQPDELPTGRNARTAAPLHASPTPRGEATGTLQPPRLHRTVTARMRTRRAASRGCGSSGRSGSTGCVSATRRGCGARGAAPRAQAAPHGSHRRPVLQDGFAQPLRAAQAVGLQSTRALQQFADVWVDALLVLLPTAVPRQTVSQLVYVAVGCVALYMLKVLLSVRAPALPGLTRSGLLRPTGFRRHSSWLQAPRSASCACRGGSSTTARSTTDARTTGA